MKDKKEQKEKKDKEIGSQSLLVWLIPCGQHRHTTHTPLLSHTNTSLSGRSLPFVRLGRSSQPFNLHGGEGEAILDQVGKIPPEINVGDHLGSAGLLGLVLESHTNGEVKENRHEEAFMIGK